MDNSADPPRTVLDVAVCRLELLAVSEGFIAAQADAVPDVRVVYVGLRRVPGVALPPAQVRLAWVRTGHLHRFIEPILKLAVAAGRSRGLTSAVRRADPDVIHVHFGPDAAILLPTIRRLPHVPLVVTFHGYDTMPPDSYHTSAVGRLWLRRRTDVFRHATTLIAVSDAVRQRLLEVGAPETKLVRHYIGVDVAPVSQPESSALDRAEHVEARILFVGRLAEVKGVADLLSAMALLHSRKVAAQLTVIGDGPLRSALHELAQCLGLPVRWLGALPKVEVATEMEVATVLCAPSRITAAGQREAFGLVIAEAQAHGLPVVAYRSGGTGEAIKDGVGGLLVDEGDVTGLADALQRVLTEPRLRAHLSAAGRADVRLRFDMQRQSAALGEIYRRAISAASQPADADGATGRATTRRRGRGAAPGR